MHRSTKQTFLEGAFVLILANALVKVIGAIFKIPMTNLIGTTGMGIFSVAYNLYSAMFVLSTAGLPVAISKMVAEANSLGRHREVKNIVRTAFYIFVIIGAMGSLVLFFGAEFFVDVIGGAAAHYSVLAIAPAIFFVSITSTIRGYYQGLSNMFPTAMSQVIEALLKLFAGYALAYYLMKSGYSAEICSAGAIAGVTIGTAVSAVYLIVKIRLDREIKHNSINSEVTRSGKQILKSLIKIAVPVTIGASVMSVTNLIDMAVVMNRLQDTVFTENEAIFLYGAYQLPLTVFNLPQTLIVAISISVIPAIASAFASKNRVLGSKTIESATKITLILALPSAIGLNILAKPILDLLYFRQSQAVIVAAPLLKILSFAVIFVAMVSLTNSILQSLGRADIPVVTMFIGGLIKLIANYTLVGMEEINIHGAPIGTTLCYATIVILNLFAIKRVNQRLPSVMQTFVKPLIASIGMGVPVYVIFNLLCSRIGSSVAVIIAMTVGGVIYATLLIFVKAITKDDANLLPKGDKIVKIFKLK